MTLLVDLSAVPFDAAALVRAITTESTDAGDTDFVTRTRNAFNPSGSLELLRDARPLVEAAAGTALAPVSTFGRVYSRGATLGEHTDREPLDWTVSLTLEADAPWPLEARVEDDLWVGHTPVDAVGVLMNGRRVRHRRSTPYAGDRSVTLLLHYRELRPYEFADQTAPARFVHVPRVLDSVDVGRVYGQFDTGELAPGTIGHAGRASSNRSNAHAWLRRPAWQWLYDRLYRTADWANARHWREAVSPASPEEIQFSRYRSGNHYGWHRDVDERSAGQTALRTISIVVLLREPQAGGGFELRDGGLVPMAVGDGVVIRAAAEHRALPVDDGTRDTLVLWLSSGGAA